ncbi:MAG: putative endonuclease containing a domain [Candidatus Eremiobacteraeota bacterium]|nr:putative endonuclease containing a domain [Candidatus Eremiobacteraeota bacterium]
MKQYWVYVLLCRDGSFYTGFTSALEQRIAEHHHGAFPDCYTFERRPLNLVHVSEFQTPTEAIAAEKKLKGWTHAKKHAFVRGDWGELRRLSRGAVRDEGPSTSSG